MKSSKSILLGLVFVLLTACSSINIQEVTSDADKAFEAKNFSKFSTDIEKLKDGNSKEYESYISKIKENNIYKIEAHSKLSELNEGTETLSKLSKDVLLLKEYSDEKLKLFSKQIDYLNKLDDSTLNILNYHVKVNENLMSKSNKFVVLMNTFEDVNETTKELEDLSASANTDIIDLEGLEPPAQYSNQHNAYTESLKKYKEALDTKKSYIDSQKSLIVSSNSLVLEANIFAVSELNDLSAEIENLTSNIKTAINDVKQRAESLQKIID
ncbi:hypothetical protein [Paenibacillus sp. IHBB 10380]|uniref:hypothetical protein n=1 Tax=Paenibacillus sp. IHBB 10380 TaxID=1566358 RepID=UPI0005CFDFD9|nr:hypothetical protein [Paenibacillus sp. IHBB 10380]AJS58252.1 hypothetical protein UB51_06805 [Paenibacillus sp. IHBB 10380]